MAVLSAAQIASILRQVGWPENLIVDMTAIALAESDGRTDALNPRGEYSVGILQININPTLRRPWTEAQLRDPVFNARIALQLYNERQARGRDGRTHWGAYTDGRYRARLSEARAAAGAGGSFNGGANNPAGFNPPGSFPLLPSPDSEITTYLLLGFAALLAVKLLRG